MRGDLKAVITAILLDPEARDTATDVSNPQFGKVREALLRYTHWARAFTAQSRTGALRHRQHRRSHLGPRRRCRSARPPSSTGLRRAMCRREHSIEQAGLVAPEMQMTNVTSVVGYLNYMQTAVGSDANEWLRYLLVLRGRDEPGGNSRRAARPRQSAAHGRRDGQHICTARF